MKGGGRGMCSRERLHQARVYTAILARIILKQESGGVGIPDRIKARANDVESLLITPCKPTVPTARSLDASQIVEMCSRIDRIYSL